MKSRSLLLFIPAALLCALSCVYFIRYLVKPQIGLVVNFPEVVLREGGVVFSPKTPFSPAVAAGLLPERDRILSVAGRSVRGIRDAVEAESSVRGFDPVAVEVLRDRAERLTVSITPILPFTRPDWVFSLLFCCTLGFMSFYLILRLPEDAASNLIALAALFYLVFVALKPYYYESFLTNLLIHLGKLTSWFMVFFALYFPSPKGGRAGRLALMLCILTAYMVFIAVRLDLFARWAGGQGDAWYQRYRLLGRWGNIADGAAFLAYAGLLAFSHIKTPRPEERRRIEWILAGFLIGVPPYFFLDQLPLILGEPPGMRISLGSFASLFLVFVPLFFMIGLLKHRAFNLRYFLLRYLVYFLLALLLFVFFLLLYEPVERFFLRVYGLPPRLTGFLVTALLFLCFIPLRAAICALLERLFFPRHYYASVRHSAALEARNRELKMLIDELNRQKRRSFQSEKMRDLRSILAGLAGRFNPAFESVAGSLNSLERRLAVPAPEAEQSRELLRGAQSAVLEIREFMHRLASLAGLRPGAPAHVGVDFLARNSVIELRRRFPQAAVRLEAGSAAMILCHPEELKQALRYLLENALEAGASAGAEVIVRTEQRGGAAGIVVEDSGPGFAGGALKRAFEPFFTTKPGHDGLGLYFCRALVERNSGSIEIFSRTGAGTRVLLQFPLGEAGA